MSTTVPTDLHQRADEIRDKYTDLSHLSAAFEWVTPELATLWLQHNSSNRTLKPRKIDAYIRDIKAGNWRVTGEAIKFASDGRLLDGQNRLTAVESSGVPIVSLVVRGLDSGAQVAMDSGVARSAADALTMNGTSNAAIAASIARLALSWRAGSIRSTIVTNLLAVTSSEVVDFQATDPCIEMATKIARASRRDIAAPPAAIGFAAWLLLQVDAPGAQVFFDDLAQMRTDGKGDPRYTLLQRLGSIRAGKEKPVTVTFAYYFVRTWNAVRLGTPLTNLKTGNAHGPFGFPDPVR